jgi:hypothetical protein
MYPPERQASVPHDPQPVDLLAGVPPIEGDDVSPQPAKPADIGRRYSHGRYEVTFVMDAEECDNVGSTFAALGDSWADELFATADEIRRLEKIRDERPRLVIELVAVPRGSA